MVEAKNPSLKEAFVSGFVGIPEGMEAHAEFKIEGGEKPIALLGEGHDLAKLHKLLSRLAKSEAGAEDLRFIAQAGYSLGYIHQEGLSGGCQPLEHLITLSPHSDDDKNLAVLAHEIRHARQFENGANSAAPHSINAVLQKICFKNDILLPSIIQCSEEQQRI